MNTTLTRSDIIDRLASMPPNARGRREWERLAERMTREVIKAELDAQLDKQIAAAFRTFPINVARALKAGRL